MPRNYTRWSKPGLAGGGSRFKVSRGEMVRSFDRLPTGSSSREVSLVFTFLIARTSSAAIKLRTITPVRFSSRKF